MEQGTITNCAWFDSELLVVATDQGTVLVTRKDSVCDTLTVFDSQPITSLKSFARGFMACTKDGKFSIWVYVNDHFELQREWLPEVKWDVVDFSIALNQEQVAIAFSNQSIATVSLVHVLSKSKDELELQRQMTTVKPVRYEFIQEGFHSGPISSMDICTQRPLIATCCSVDSTIKIWNYSTY